MPDETVRKSDSTPGPAHYALPSTVGHAKHDISKSRGPSFTMGVRLPGFFCDKNMTSPSPGPKYQVEYMTKYGRANLPATASAATSSVKVLKRPQSAPYDGDDANRLRTCYESPRRFRNGFSATGKCSTNASGDMSEKSGESRKNIKLEISSQLSINNRLRAFCSEYRNKPYATNLIRNAKISNTRKYMDANALDNDY